jgi:dienelactone hydrolase
MFFRIPHVLIIAACMAGGARAQDKQAAPIDRYIRGLLDEAPLKLKFQGKTAGDALAWQKAFGAELRKSLGPIQPPTTWQVTVERVVDLDDHRREELVLTAPGVAALPLYLLTPKGATGKRPGILALHGHGAFGADAVVGRELTEGIGPAIASANYDYGRQLVRRGYVVVAPGLLPFGRRLGATRAERNQDQCGTTFVRLQLLGKLLIAENVRDCLWALDYLARRPEVDADRLGCVGLSYGGRMTMLTAALEPRIKVAVISGALNCMQERISGRYGCGAQVIPGLLQYGDTPEIAALIAPRPCLWEVGLRDALAPAEWVQKALERMEPVYQALGAGSKLEVERFEGGHRWNGKRGVELLDDVLKGHSARSE